jgi:hypothetical protein
MGRPPNATGVQPDRESRRVTTGAAPAIAIQLLGGFRVLVGTQDIDAAAFRLAIAVGGHAQHYYGCPTARIWGIPRRSPPAKQRHAGAPGKPRCLPVGRLLVSANDRSDHAQ